MKKRALVGSGVCLGLSIISGLVTYQLSDIPFGTAFSISFHLTFLCLSFALFGLAFVLCLSERVWIRSIGIIPAVLGLGILVVQIAVQADPRVIHYRGIPPSPTAQEWQEDARFLVGEMEAKHADLFALVDRTLWDSVTADAVSRIPSLSEAGILMELTRIVGLPKDGHTFPFIMAPCFRLHSFPVVLYGFPEGWYVVKTGRGLNDLVGAKLLSVGGRDIEDIFETCSQLIAWENEQSRREHFTYMITMAEWLTYHGLIDDVDEATFTFLTADGDTAVRTISSVDFWPQFLWTGVFPIANDAPPVFTNSREDAYTFRTLDDGKALYVQFNQCIDQPGRETAKDFALEVERYLDDHPVERCIIDLRNNDGGQRVYTELLRVIRDNPSIDRRGHLFVLTGRRTFSAAVMFSTEIQLQTNALLVGEPTGQGPIFYSRPRLTELPHSGLKFAISGYHNIAGLPFDTREAIEPDIAVPYGIDDFLSGRDPVMTAALTYQEPAAPVAGRSQTGSWRIAGRYQKDETMLLEVSEQNGTLSCRVTDALPNTSALFLSALRASDDGSYATRLPDVSLRFGMNRSGDPVHATLHWMGEEVRFLRADDAYQIPFERFAESDIAGGCSMIRADAERYMRLYPNLEFVLNQLGYQYLRGGETPEALQVFLLNVELYPLSSNVYDSYGEALMVNDQIDSSIASYTRSLELNPDNDNAARVIERLRELQ